MVRTRVEPKTHFANERTFLQWLQIGVLVLMTGLGLLTGSAIMMDNNANGDACKDSWACYASRVSAWDIMIKVHLPFLVLVTDLRNSRSISRYITSRSSSSSNS